MCSARSPCGGSEAAASACSPDHTGSRVLGLAQRRKGLLRGSHSSRTQLVSLCQGSATHQIHTTLPVAGLANTAFGPSLTTKDLTDPHRSPSAATLPAGEALGAPSLQLSGQPNIFLSSGSFTQAATRLHPESLGVGWLHPHAAHSGAHHKSCQSPAWATTASSPPPSCLSVRVLSARRDTWDTITLRSGQESSLRTPPGKTTHL